MYQSYLEAAEKIVVRLSCLEEDNVDDTGISVVDLFNLPDRKLLYFFDLLGIQRIINNMI